MKEIRAIVRPQRLPQLREILRQIPNFPGLTFTKAEGLSWKDPAGRTRTETDLRIWEGNRAATGAMAPRGFPRDNKFT